MVYLRTAIKIQFKAFAKRLNKNGVVRRPKGR